VDGRRFSRNAGTVASGAGRAPVAGRTGPEPGPPIDPPVWTVGTLNASVTSLVRSRVTARRGARPMVLHSGLCAGAGRLLDHLDTTRP